MCSKEACPVLLIYMKFLFFLLVPAPAGLHIIQVAGSWIFFFFMLSAAFWVLLCKSWRETPDFYKPVISTSLFFQLFIMFTWVISGRFSTSSSSTGMKSCACEGVVVPTCHRRNLSLEKATTSDCLQHCGTSHHPRRFQHSCRHIQLHLPGEWPPWGHSRLKPVHSLGWAWFLARRGRKNEASEEWSSKFGDVHSHWTLSEWKTFNTGWMLCMTGEIICHSYSCKSILTTWKICGYQCK